MRRSATLCSLLCLNMLATAKVPSEGARVALVIGNSTYSGLWPDLHTEPQRDAQLMRDTLTSLGFQVVYRDDADLEQMQSALRDFRTALRAAPGSLAVVYYAGHGTQAFLTNPKGAVRIENFLVPARTDLDNEADVPQKAIPVERVESIMRASGAAAGVVLLDASRDNALPHSRDGVPAALHGLAPHRSADQVVMFSTRPGRLSYRTRNDMPSVFTQALAQELATPGTIGTALQRVRDRVREATEERPFGAQQPALQNRLGQDYALLMPGDGGTPQATPESFRDCAMCPELVRVPPGAFVMGSPDEEAQREASEGPTHEVHITYSLAVSKYPITRGQWRAYLGETGRHPSNNCYGFNNTVWKRAKTLEYSWDDPGYRQEDNHPVVCVTWNEAQEYTAWLSQRTGHHYRLLSETELEYLERTGKPNTFPWGPTSETQCFHVNAADAKAKARFPAWTASASCNDGFLFTSPVDHFRASTFGLYDLDGNVRSWAQDCYHESYKNAPADGSAWESGGDCAQRMIRGAAWDTTPEGLRSAARHWDLAESNTDNTGMRVARTDLPPPGTAKR